MTDQPETVLRDAAEAQTPFAVMVTLDEVLTHFLEGYDLGKLGDPTLKTSDITRDLLNTPELRAVKAALHTASMDIIDSYTNWETQREALSDFLGLPDVIVEWVVS